MKKLTTFQTRRLIAAVLLGLCSSVFTVQAAPGGNGNGKGNGGGGGGQPPGGETGANNLSFPLILSDNASPAAFPLDGAWRFANINSETDCIGEVGVTPGTPVPADKVCYYGRHITVVSETGEIVFDGDPCPSVDCKVWWLQKRTQNFWKTLSVAHNTDQTPLVVSAVDVGDLLESSPSIQARQIRVEFNLLQNVSSADPEFGQYVVTDWTNPVPAPCVLPTAAGNSLGCFAALGMSGAVPGTEQSGNEMQGTDFGPGPSAGLLTGTQTLLDPTTVKKAVTADGSTLLPIHALVYSNCARLLIQKIAPGATWNAATGQWTGAGVGAPLVNIATYTGAWTTEITSGGSIVYGYNWNAKTASTGTYRLTMVLDGNDDEGPQCSGTTLATKFEAPTATTAGTQLVNLGEANTSTTLINAGDSQLGDEGGIAYIDVPLTTKGGGKKGGN